MSSIAEPDEVVQAFVDVMQGDIGMCLVLLDACADDDISDLVGAMEGVPLEYVPGELPVEHVVILAQALAWHGITGAQEPRPGAKYSKTFDASEYAAMAVAHLGMSEREAWDMTMTGLLAAMRAKFPDAHGTTEAPTAEQHDATMKWFEKVERARRSRQGAH